jgi:hypothetical protein
MSGLTAHGKKVVDRLLSSEPGDVVVYHVGGYLPGGALSEYAWFLQEAGAVCLVQRRVPEGFEYTAVRTRMLDVPRMPKGWVREKVR